MLLEEFQQQSTLNGVAQAVVDKIVRTHHDAFMTDSESKKRCQKREDITLLVSFCCLNSKKYKVIQHKILNLASSGPTAG